MKIVFVGLRECVHTNRWIKNILSGGWEIHFFHTRLGLPVSTPYRIRRLEFGLPGVVVHGFPEKSESISPNRRLAHLIRDTAPDFVHGFGVRLAGPLIAEARKRVPGGFSRRFPQFVLSSLGSELYMLNHFSSGRSLLKRVLQDIDVLLCENQREESVARKLGFNGKIPTPFFPQTGGYDSQKFAAVSRRPPSERKIILLKGHQGIQGRAFVALRALERCADLLSDYEIWIHGFPRELEPAIVDFRERTRIRVKILPWVAHRHQVRRNARARISLALTKADGIPSSTLEAMLMGAFPIQSEEATLASWIDHGRNGFIVPSEEPAVVAKFLRIALKNDALVNRAAALNVKRIQKRLEEKVHASRMNRLYRILNDAF